MRPPAASNSPKILASRGAAMVVFAAITLVVAVTIAGAGTGELLYRFAVDGALLMLWLSAGYGIGGLVVARIGGIGDVNAALKWCTGTALGLGMISLVVLGL